MPTALKYILVAVIAYLLGSFSSGLTTAQVGHGPDLRRVGSKNTGASNVLRTMGVRWGIVTFLGDFLKGALASGLGWWLTGLVYGAMLGGLCAIVGHNWPVYYHFKGGKGVATSTAVGLVCFPLPALIAYAAALLTIWLTRFISLGSLVFVTVFALIVIFFFSGWDWLIIVWAVAIAVICFYRHRANLDRLRKGTERKIGEKVK